MFQFTGFPLSDLCVQSEVTAHYDRRVSPFGDLRINAYLRLPAAYRVLRRLLVPRHPPYALCSLILVFCMTLFKTIFDRLPAISDVRFFPCVFLRNCSCVAFTITAVLFLVFAVNSLYAVFKVLAMPCPFRNKWWAQVDSNHRPHAYQACALTS